MEFENTIKEFNRMCWHYRRNNECPMGCPMNGINISQCRKEIVDNPVESEKIILDWSIMHPDSLTWRQFLASYGILIRSDGTLRFVEGFPEDRVPDYILELFQEKKKESDIS